MEHVQEAIVLHPTDGQPVRFIHRSGEHDDGDLFEDRQSCDENVQAATDRQHPEHVEAIEDKEYESRPAQWRTEEEAEHRLGTDWQSADNVPGRADHRPGFIGIPAVHLRVADSGEGWSNSDLHYPSAQRSALSTLRLYLPGGRWSVHVRRHA